MSDVPESNSKKPSITERFQKRRSDVSKEIYESIERLSNLKTLKDAQVQMLSLRQRLLEDNHTLLENITMLIHLFHCYQGHSNFMVLLLLINIPFYVVLNAITGSKGFNSYTLHKNDDYSS